MPARPLWNERQIDLLIRGLRCFGRDYERIRSVFLSDFNATQIKNKHYYLKITNVITDDELNTIRYSPRSIKGSSSQLAIPEADSVTISNASVSLSKCPGVPDASWSSAKRAQLLDALWSERACSNTPPGCSLECDSDFINKLAALLQ